jgi:hypothetical protein
VDKENVAKVADLGLAREINLEMTHGVGTPKWYVKKKNRQPLPPKKRAARTLSFLKTDT